jgi:hypothetical protein
MPRSREAAKSPVLEHIEEAYPREPTSIIIRQPVDWLGLRERGPLSGP